MSEVPGSDLLDPKIPIEAGIYPLAAAMSRLPGIRVRQTGTHPYRVFFYADVNQPGILALVYFTGAGWDINLTADEGRVYFMLTAISEVVNERYMYGDKGAAHAQELAARINDQVDGKTSSERRTYRDPCIAPPYGWGPRLPFIPPEIRAKMLEELGYVLPKERLRWFFKPGSNAHPNHQRTEVEAKAELPRGVRNPWRPIHTETFWCWYRITEWDYKPSRTSNRMDLLRKEPLTPERIDEIIDESMEHKDDLRRYMAGQFKLPRTK